MVCKLSKPSKLFEKSKRLLLEKLTSTNWVKFSILSGIELILLRLKFKLWSEITLKIKSGIVEKLFPSTLSKVRFSKFEKLECIDEYALSVKFKYSIFSKLLIMDGIVPLNPHSIHSKEVKYPFSHTCSPRFKGSEYWEVWLTNVSKNWKFESYNQSELVIWMQSITLASNGSPKAPPIIMSFTHNSVSVVGVK